MKKSVYLLLIITLFSRQIIAHDSIKTYPLNRMHEWTDALNIEGGTIPKQLRQGQKWFNVATVLDRPYIDGIEFDSMAKNKVNGSMFFLVFIIFKFV